LCAKHYQRLMKLRHSCVIDDIAPDWQNAAEMIRVAGYVHPAEVIESLAAELIRVREKLHV
jgi:hypothetical protein